MITQTKQIDFLSSYGRKRIQKECPIGKVLFWVTDKGTIKLKIQKVRINRPMNDGRRKVVVSGEVVG